MSLWKYIREFLAFRWVFGNRKQGLNHDLDKEGESRKFFKEDYEDNIGGRYADYDSFDDLDGFMEDMDDFDMMDDF